MKILLLCVSLLIAITCQAALQNWQSARTEAEAQIRREMAGQTFVLKWDAVTPPTLPRCEKIEYSWPTQARGKIFITARCTKPQQWSTRLPAWLSPVARIAFIRQNLPREHLLTEADIEWKEVELASYPEDVLSSPKGIVDRVLKQAVQAGQPLRVAMLRGAYWVMRNQTVQIMVQNPQFSIKTEGIANANAAEGERVQVKTSNGRLLEGIVRGRGLVEVTP